MRCDRGTTLVEALAGTALLGTLLVSVLMTSARVNGQSARAQQRIQACQLADSLLQQWWDKRDQMPRSGGGPIKEAKGWTWRTRTADSNEATALNAQIVVVEVYAPPVAGEGRQSPAASVELLLPKHANQPQQGTDAR